MGAEPPGWFDVSPKISAQDMMNKQACCHDEIANHQFPIDAAFWIIQIVSTEERSSLMQNVMQTRFSTHAVILNGQLHSTDAHSRVSYHPHWLVEWIRHCSRMRIPVHSPCSLGYIGVAQTILIILTVAWLFPDRPRICLDLVSTTSFTFFGWINIAKLPSKWLYQFTFS